MNYLRKTRWQYFLALFIALGLLFAPMAHAATGRTRHIVIKLLDKLGITVGGLYTPPTGGHNFGDTGELDILVFEAATTDGVLLKLNAGVLEVRKGDDSADANVILSSLFASNVIVTNALGLLDDDRLEFGNTDDSTIRWSTVQATAHNTVWGIRAAGDGTGGGTLILTELANAFTDHQRPVSSEVTLAIYDANTDPSVDETKYIALWHDGTTANIAYHAGGVGISLQNHSGTQVAQFATGGVKFSTSTWVIDDKPLTVGSALDAGFEWATDQTNHGMLWWPGDTSNYVQFIDFTHKAVDYGHANQSDPTLFLHANSATTTEWLSVSHVGGSGQIDTGTSTLNLQTVGTTRVKINTSGLTLPAGDGFFQTAGSAAAATDVNFGRIDPGTWGIGTGTLGTTDGTLNLATLNFTGSVSGSDDDGIKLGTGGADMILKWSTVQATAAQLMLAIDADDGAGAGGALLLTHYDNRSKDHHLAVSSEVKLVIFSGTTDVDADATRHMDLWDDGTDANLNAVNTFNVKINGSDRLSIGAGNSTFDTNLFVEGNLNVDSNAANTSPILSLENTAGDVQIFRVDADPEGSITGSRGDLAVGIVAGEGVVFVKHTGDATSTGWAELAVSHYADMHVHGNSTTTTIDTQDTPHLVQGLFVEELSDGITFSVGSTGAITALADAGGGQITVTSAGHGLANGDVVSISGTSNNDGIFIVANVGATFEITDAFVATDTGTWNQGDSMTVDTGSAGRYKVSVSGYGTASSPNTTFIFDVFNNTTNQISLEGSRRFSSSDVGAFSGGGIIILADGDILTFGLVNSTDTTNFTINHVNISIHRL